MKKPRVYVLQDDGTKNLYPATKFGEVVVFTRHEMSVFNIAEWVDEVRDWLKHYDPDHDFILPVGDPALISVVSALTAQVHSCYSILKWDRQSRTYIPIKVDLGGDQRS